jgi:hypothetical protein
VAVREPRFGFPDGSAFHCRVTATTRKEADTWRLVQRALVRSAPDDEVFAFGVCRPAPVLDLDLRDDLSAWPKHGQGSRDHRQRLTSREREELPRSDFYQDFYRTPPNRPSRGRVVLACPRTERHISADTTTRPVEILRLVHVLLSLPGSAAERRHTRCAATTRSALPPTSRPDPRECRLVSSWVRRAVSRLTITDSASLERASASVSHVSLSL